MSRARKLASIWHGLREVAFRRISLSPAHCVGLSSGGVARGCQVADAPLGRSGTDRWRSYVPVGLPDDHPVSPAADEAPVGEGSR